MPPQSVIGHEGNIAPDGLTYYIGDIRRGAYHAVDITNTTKPKLIATYNIANLGLATGTTVHGLSISNDGNRTYAVVLGHSVSAPGPAPMPANSQQRLRDLRHVGNPGAQAERADQADLDTRSSRTARSRSTRFPIKISGKQYLVMVDEGGSGGPCQRAQPPQAACAPAWRRSRWRASTTSATRRTRRSSPS